MRVWLGWVNERSHALVSSSSSCFDRSCFYAAQMDQDHDQEDKEEELRSRRCCCEIAVMLKFTTRSETGQSLSARPADFANASPFPSRTKTKDPARTAILAAAAIAIAAFLASMIALFLARPPAL
jgi:hypothetical protein